MCKELIFALLTSEERKLNITTLHKMKLLFIGRWSNVAVTHRQTLCPQRSRHLCTQTDIRRQPQQVGPSCDHLDVVFDHWPDVSTQPHPVCHLDVSVDYTWTARNNRLDSHWPTKGSHHSAEAMASA